MIVSDLKKQINEQIADAETFKTLLQTTFKGLQPSTAKTAMLDAMMRGWEFKDFLVKNVYAIPFNNRNTGIQEYSLVSSVDHARKVGMRSGVCGKSAPVFEEKDGKIISCSITIKRKINEYVGDYSSTVYFDEYNTGRNLWINKPRTMIAKVAEMHALRMACPEELSQMFIEEEFAQEENKIKLEDEKREDKILEDKTKLEACKNIEELKTVWATLTATSKAELKNLKEILKEQYESKKI